MPLNFPLLSKEGLRGGPKTNCYDNVRLYAKGQNVLYSIIVLLPAQYAAGSNGYPAGKGYY